MSNIIRVAELFAGVGGFRLALDGYSNESYPEFNMPSAGPFKTIWANQWEPPGTETKQFAARCYEERFGSHNFVNEDIHKVIDRHKSGNYLIPDVDMVVGGFPCQDYSVAKPLSHAGGIEGKKGILWWDIYEFLKLKRPEYVLLENVDRLLKSPATQRGRDFAIMLTCFANLNYQVEWRVINSAEYGFSQRRKRVYIYAELSNSKWALDKRIENGIFAEAFPIKNPILNNLIILDKDPYAITQAFNLGGSKSPFDICGAMSEFKVISGTAEPHYTGEFKTLGDVLSPQHEIPESFYISEHQRERWEYLKGSKKEERTNKKTGFKYFYSEGSMAFPDPIDRPSRTILTGEGGQSASRFKHVIQTGDNKLRRLVPDELDQLQGFPKGWTDIGMSDNQRAFCMGNALVVGIPHRIGFTLAKHLS